MTQDLTLRELGEIEARAINRLRKLSYQFARAKGPRREGLFAEMEFQRWLAESCRFARS